MAMSGDAQGIARIRVVVRTARRNEALSRCIDGSLSVEVHARPVDGKANAAVIALIAHAGRVPKSSVEIIAGFHGRHKTVTLPQSSYERLCEAYPIE